MKFCIFLIVCAGFLIKITKTQDTYIDCYQCDSCDDVNDLTTLVSCGRSTTTTIPTTSNVPTTVQPPEETETTGGSNVASTITDNPAGTSSTQSERSEITDNVNTASTPIVAPTGENTEETTPDQVPIPAYEHQVFAGARNSSNNKLSDQSQQLLRKYRSIMNGPQCDNMTYACYTISIKNGNSKKIRRGCIAHPTEKTACDALRERDDLNENDVSCMSCKESLCNGTSALGITLAALLISIMIKYFL